MKVVCLLLPLALTCAACGQSRSGPSSLQKLDGMRAPLSSTTALANEVAADIGWLQRRMNQQNIVAVQRVTVRLKEHALQLCRASGRNGYALRNLLQRSRTMSMRRYLRMALRVMVLQWYEGASLRHVADLVWHDPYLSQNDDAQRLYRLQRLAAQYALEAGQTAQNANHYLSTHRKQFSYVALPLRH